MVCTGCDDTFTPIAPSDLQLSIFGYLDASADTQWIRIMPLRSTTPTATGPLGATVTVQEVGTGPIVELRDSVFHFFGNPEVGSDGRFLHNYWTTEPIEPGATYRFSAKLDAEKLSEALVTIPAKYDVEVWLKQDSQRDNVLRLVGLKYVAFAQIVTYYYDECGSEIDRTALGTGSAASDTQMIPVRGRASFRGGCGEPKIDRQDLFVMGSGSPWPSGDFSPGALGIADTTSNVSNAIGYLGGVLTRVVPYEACRILGFGQTEYCKLHYDETVAMLIGTVTDAKCGDFGIAGASVELLQLDPISPARPKLRFTDSGLSGAYRIGALEAGRYALRVNKTFSDPSRNYLEYTDTLEFVPGEHRTYEVGLIRPDCPR